MSEPSDRERGEPGRKQRDSESDHPREHVLEAALALYALQPFAPNDKSKCMALMEQAFGFLDNLREAYKMVRQLRCAMLEKDRRDAPDREKAEMLPDIVPHEKAMRFITREKRTKRAEEKFQRLIRAVPSYYGFGSPPGQPLHLTKVNAMIKRSRKNGMTRDEVTFLQYVFDITWARIISDLQREKAKKRKRRGAYGGHLAQ